MKTAETIDDEMRPEYKREDLGKGVRGKFYQSYLESHNLVLLNPEVARIFPSEDGEDRNSPAIPGDWIPASQPE